MRITVLAVMLALASGLEAQGGKYAHTYGRRLTQAELATAVRECDQKILRPPCTEVVRVAEKMFPAFGKGNLQLADYIASLEERPCPAGTVLRSTTWVPAGGLGSRAGHIDLPSMNTICTSGESLLWDKELGRPVVSLYDGTFIESYTGPTSQVVAASAETTQTGTASVPATQVDTPVTKPAAPRRTTTSDARIPVTKPPATVPPRTIVRVDTVFLNNTVVRVDTVRIETHEKVEVFTQPRAKGTNPWPWVGLLAALGVGAWAGCEYVFDCGRGDINNTNININNNGMVPLRRAGFQLRLP